MTQRETNAAKRFTIITLNTESSIAHAYSLPPVFVNLRLATSYTKIRLYILTEKRELDYKK